MPIPSETSSPNSESIDADSRRSSARDSSKPNSTPRHLFPVRRKFMLPMLGLLVGIFTLFSLSIGHYYNRRYINEIFSKFGSASSLIQIQLQESKSSFFREDVKAKVDMAIMENEATSRARKKSTLTPNKSDPGTSGSDKLPSQRLIHESEVFKSIIERVQWTERQCSQTLDNQRNTVTKQLKVATDTPLLPEGGVASALQNWTRQHQDSKPSSDPSYPTCYLPPKKSCNVTTYTLIIMSHTTERLDAFMPQLESMVQTWPGLTEIIIVWNSPRTTLTSVMESTTDSKEKQYASQLLSWDSDPSHPLRIFFSSEEGLTNNLLNRYHPKLQPVNEAVMYFDDDGPFWSKEAMIDVGLELWKRNSNVQVGGFPRNVRFLSNRMKDAEKLGLQASIDLIVKDAPIERGGGGINDGYPNFTPICRNVTGDILEYNYFVFPDFAAHMLLPSGSFLHRNYLCFIWHPAFEELRQYVITHKTMPDDMTVSTLVSHLAGRAPRTFPREVETRQKRRLSTQASITDISIRGEIEDDDTRISQHTDRSIDGCCGNKRTGDL
ncbi:hypothetical protein HJC23_005938 [Cyclotella cryptica]|uniref:Glycosyl transferase 64 domain-containing protein n=1 Tax=Cyclotella cryptica TaxID=29204 RepID=A0ABD3R027_9STRA